MALILVVEDSELIRLAVEMILRERGWDVTGAADGVEGIEKFRADPDLRLVISDHHMPRMTGLEFLECISQEAQARGVALAMCTSDRSEELRACAEAAGVRHWLPKPLDWSDLDGLDQLLGNRPGRPLGAEVWAAPGTGP